MKASSESLAATIIANRTLGLYPDEAKYCISELLRRREDEGDPFDFEKYIDNQIQIIETNNESSRSGNQVMNLMTALSSIGKII